MVAEIDYNYGITAWSSANSVDKTDFMSYKSML